MVYGSNYTMLDKYGERSQFQGVGRFCFSFLYMGGDFNKTIIPLAFVGYKMIVAKEARSAELAIYHLMSNAGS